MGGGRGGVGGEGVGGGGVDVGLGGRKRIVVYPDEERVVKESVCVNNS